MSESLQADNEFLGGDFTPTRTGSTSLALARTRAKMSVFFIRAAAAFFFPGCATHDAYWSNFSVSGTAKCYAIRHANSVPKRPKESQPPSCEQRRGDAQANAGV